MSYIPRALQYKTHSILWVLIFLPFLCIGQNLLKGKITDSLQKPLPYVNILANPQDSLKNIKFAISAENGNYELDLEDVMYDISISHLGFESVSFEIDPTTEKTRDIVLREGNQVLETVILELPVVTKEDTIIFNVEKLVTGEERKLKDVLKKLPGVELDKDGTITVRGKEVTKVLVEDKEFFGGGSKLAVDNIPADAINQIEILENYNEVAFLKELQDSDEIALNVKLKEDKKRFVFGDIEGGKGNENFYGVHSNLFYYGPKTTVNAIGDINNIREKVFTNNQYFDDYGDINAVFKQGKTRYDSPDKDLSQFSEASDVVESDRKFGGFNFTQVINTKVTIEGYGLISATDENTRTETFNRYNTFTEDRNLNTSTDNLFAIGKLELDYLPNLTDQWFFKTKFKSAANDYDSDLLSVTDTQTNLFTIDQEADETVFNQIIEWHKKKSRAHTFSSLLTYDYTELSPQSKWETSDQILNGLIPVEDEDIINLEQKKRIKTHQLDATFKHYWILNRNNHIYTTLGNVYLKQELFTRDFQNLEDGGVNNFGSSGFGNDVIFGLNDLFIGVHYKFKTGIFTFDQGAFIHNYNWKIDQSTLTENSKTVVLPSFSVETKIDQNKEINLDYSLQTSFSDVSQYTNRLYLRSYNSIYSGNPDIQNDLYHSARLRFFKYSSYRGFRYYGSARYRKKIRGVIRSIQFQEINQSLTTLFIDNPETQWNVNGSVSKKVSRINLRAGLGYSSNNYIQQVNEDRQENENENINYSFSARTLYKNFPNVTAGFRQNIGRFTLAGSTNTFVTSQPYAELEYDFWNGFIASFEYAYFNYNNETLNQENDYSIAEASLFYQKENSAWSFKLEGQNLFNATLKNSNRFSSFVISDTRTFVLPRIIVFSIGYNL